MMTPPSVFIIFTLHMKLTLIGAGKLGKQLYYEFVKHPSIELIEWIDRSSNSKQTAEGIKITKSLDSLQKAEIYLMAVNDDAIPSVSSQLPSNEFVIHTSGGTPMTAISQKRKGVFYPIQSFSSNRTIDFSQITFGLESTTENDFKILQKLAQSVYAKTIQLNSLQRQGLHLAAVLVNNFTNHLFSHAAKVCEQNELSFDILQPLIQETVDRLNLISPDEAQTGPAIRRDQKTITEHLRIIEDPELKKLYQLLTKSIQNYHGS
jgi:predicted short-subunit dehydrogenase-like oxidoreductase (DUF2520 family)